MSRTAATSLRAGWRATWDALMNQRWLLPVLVIAGFLLSLAIPMFNLLNQYIQLVLIYVGINIILTVSLNLVNGYMGEFSVGHAGFMAVGAYVASILTVKVFPESAQAFLFPVALLAGGAVAGLMGLIVALPSFKTRGDYLAIVTLAFLMIVKSVIENIDAIGGPRGFLGMSKLTSLPWTYVCTVIALWMIRNLVYSRFGRGVQAIREDEIATELISVNTRQVKLQAFIVSSFFAGVAGGLFAHVLQFINPRTFDITKSTDILVMVYLGGIGSVAGSIVGASVYTVLLELLRPLGVWRMVFMPLVLVLLMLYRPRGIMGLREFRWFVPGFDLVAARLWRQRKEGGDAPAPG
jgi:branched-chain amino acid transport system permease protein